MTLLTSRVPIPAGQWTEIAGPVTVQTTTYRDMLFALCTATGDVSANAPIESVPAFLFGKRTGESNSVAIKAGQIGVFRSPQDIATVVTVVAS